MKNNTQVNHRNRLVIKSFSIPIWMENYLFEKSSKENKSVSDILRDYIQRDFDLNNKQETTEK